MAEGTHAARAGKADCAPNLLKLRIQGSTWARTSSLGARIALKLARLLPHRNCYFLQRLDLASAPHASAQREVQLDNFQEIESFEDEVYARRESRDCRRLPASGWAPMGCPEGSTWLFETM